jgi:hypothetical protein
MKNQITIAEQIRLGEDRERERRILCMKHPDWRPDPRFPDPPPGSCPHCKTAAEGNRPRPRTEERRISIVESVPSSQSEIAMRWFEAHPDKAPWVDREAEAEALDRIAVAREAEELETERKRHSVRIPGARMTSYNLIRGTEYWLLPGDNQPVEVKL